MWARLLSLAVGLIVGGACAAQAQSAVPFECRGDGVTFHVGHEEGNPDWVFVDAEFFGARAGEQLEFALPAIPAGSGYRFARDFAEFRGKGEEAFLEYEGQRIECVPVRAALGTGAGPGNLARAGQSLGGNLRAGPGTQYDRLDGLAEGAPLTIEAFAGVLYDGYEWFEVTVGGRRGYMWGGILCSEGLKLPGIFAECATLATDAGSGGPAAWMAFAIDSRGGVGHGAASTEAQASLFAEQFCGNPDCRIVDTTQAQCHALAHFIEGEAYYYDIAAGDRQDSVEFEALGRCSSASLGASCDLVYSYCK